MVRGGFVHGGSAFSPTADVYLCSLYSLIVFRRLPVTLLRRFHLCGFFVCPQNRELQIMRQLEHENIVRLKFFFYSSGEKVSLSASATFLCTFLGRCHVSASGFYGPRTLGRTSASRACPYDAGSLCWGDWRLCEDSLSAVTVATRTGDNWLRWNCVCAVVAMSTMEGHHC